MKQVDSKVARWLKERFNPLLVTLGSSKVKYDIESINNFCAIPGKPIIFAANHSTPYDIPVIIKVTNRHSYVFLGKQNLPLIDRIFFALNGAIFADRKSRMETVEVKKRLLEYLLLGQSVIWFPEGTWNLTANLLMLPMKWGIIEVACKADAQIIAMALDFDRGKNLCRVKFAEPITGDALKSKEEGINLLRDTIATLRWKMMIDRPVLSRVETDSKMLQADVEKYIEEYPSLDWEYEQSCIFIPPKLHRAG